MSKVDLSSVYTKCAVLGCPSHAERHPKLHRHHRGCELMFVKHFAHKAGTKRYDEFTERYYAFDKRDVIPLCEGHHRVVHEIVYAPILRRIFKKVGKPVKDWTWRQARILINSLRTACDEWLENTRGKPLLIGKGDLRNLTF